MCFVPRAVRDPGCIGKQAHGEQTPAQEGSISNGGPALDLSLWKGAKGLPQTSVFEGLGCRLLQFSDKWHCSWLL